MTIFKHFSESHSFNTKSLFIGHLLQHIRFLFLDDLAIKFKKSIKFFLSKFSILVEQYRLNQMGKIPFFKPDRRGFLTPSWRDKDVLPIGSGANLEFFKELK